jgi:hypothetical protein
MKKGFIESKIESNATLIFNKFILLFHPSTNGIFITHSKIKRNTN